MVKAFSSDQNRNHLSIMYLLFARIVKIFTANKRFIIDKWFIFWSLLNAFTIWLGYLIIHLIGLANQLGTIVLIAVLLVLISHIIRRFRLQNTRLIVLSIVIIAILFFAANAQSDFKNGENMNSESSNYQDKISNIKENIIVKVDELKEDLDLNSEKNKIAIITIESTINLVFC